MSMVRKCLLFILSFWLLAVILPDNGECWLPRRYRRRATARRRVLRAQKKYRYIRSHDFNGDGMVDARDRLIWLRDNKSYGVVYISDDNQDIVEVMDIDGNGNVERWEMVEFYDSYDTDKDGILEDSEIDTVIEVDY